MNNTQQERIQYLDLLRFSAIIAVIFLHVAAKGYISLTVNTQNWYIAAVCNCLVRWAVPMFVMISGALFLLPEKEITIKDIFLKYIRRLLIAYLFWFFAYVCFDTVLISIKHGVLTFEKSLVEPKFHLWFLPMLMGVYMLIPLLRKIARDETLLLYSLLLWGVYITLAPFLEEIIIPQISILFNMNIIIGYAGYFLFGYFLSSLPITNKACNVVYLLGFTGVVITIVGSIIFSLRQGSPSDSFLFEISPQVAITTAALFVFFRKHFPSFDRAKLGRFEYLRKDIFGIYLVHVIWLWVFDRSLIRDMCCHAVTIPLISFSVFACSLLSTRLLRKIPFIRHTVE